MPSTYTSNGGIEKIGLGEKAGAWGTTTNNNFDIIDRLTNGVGAITLSGTTHTLTTSDGSLSDGMFKVLVLGGSPSGTNTITISPNDADKLYFVQNGTSQTATFTQGSGANVSIASGEAAIIFADGAAATIMGATSDTKGILSTHLHTEGKYLKELWVEAPSSKSNPKLDKKIQLYAQRRLTARAWRFAKRYEKVFMGNYNFNNIY